MEITSGVFALCGAIIGGLFTCLATKIGNDKERANKNIRILCDQVSAYHKLEEYYKAEVSKLNNKTEKTVMEEMRSKVQEIESFERPTMTVNQANKIKTKYS